MIKQKEKDKIEKKKGKGFTISDLVIPVLSVILFIILIIFVYLPMLKEAEEVKAETGIVTSQIDKLNRNLNSIKNIDITELDEVEELFKTALPKRVEVAEVAKYVDELAFENNLTLSNINASNNRDVKEEMETNIWAINTPLVYRGHFDDILEFLSELYESSPYLISNSGFSLKILEGNTQDSDSIWQIEITITGYYIEDTNEFIFMDLKIQDFEPYSIEEKNIELLRKKAKQID